MPPPTIGSFIGWQFVAGRGRPSYRFVLRLLPVFGVPLPFLSQGGTSLVSVLIACGVLLSFARTLPARAPAAAAGTGRDRISR